MTATQELRGKQISLRCQEGPAARPAKPDLGSDKPLRYVTYTAPMYVGIYTNSKRKSHIIYLSNK